MSRVNHLASVYKILDLISRNLRTKQISNIILKGTKPNKASEELANSREGKHSDILFVF